MARLEPHDQYKGVDTLVEAWPMVLAAHPDAELLVAGEAAIALRLERLAADGATDGRIRFTGRVDDRELPEPPSPASLRLHEGDGARLPNRSSGSVCSDETRRQRVVIVIPSLHRREGKT